MLSPKAQPLTRKLPVYVHCFHSQTEGIPVYLGCMELLTALAVAALTGLTFIAYRYPNAFAKLYRVVWWKVAYESKAALRFTRSEKRQKQTFALAAKRTFTGTSTTSACDQGCRYSRPMLLMSSVSALHSSIRPVIISNVTG